MNQSVCRPVKFHFVCPLPNGLHARPASELAEFAGGFLSEFRLTNLRNGVAANLKSTLAILSADIRSGDECTVQILGEDEESAGTALQAYINSDLPKSDEPLLPAAAKRANGPLPRALQRDGLDCHFGVAVSPGIGKGKAVVIGGLTLPRDLHDEEADPKREERRIERALAALRERIKGMLSHSMSSPEAGVLRAHLTIVEDVSLAEKVAELIHQGRSAGQALVESAQFFCSLLQRTDSAYMRDRALDIQEICLRLLEEIYGSRFRSAPAQLTESSIVVAETLGPQQLLSMERKWLKGLVLEYAGTTSHAVIVARSLGIPTVVGVENAPTIFSDGRELVVDAHRGLVLRNGAAPVQRFYLREQQTLETRLTTLARSRKGQVATKDGRRLEVAANISSQDEILPAIDKGAESIGLFRTEMMFLGRDDPPSEEEQFAIYKQAALSAEERPVIIRTVDIGGDKPAPHLNLPAEANPYLGYRGMRIYTEHAELFRTQLRAVLRASAFGRLQLMAPMVSTVGEVRWLKRQIVELQNELASRGEAFNAAMPIGIMIEVPSVAFILDHLSAEVDFFSIGTNDLNQYFLAVDRDNPKVAELSSVRHPSFLRLLQKIVHEARSRDKWIGMCGEMAADARNLPILIGLGLNEISASASQIPDLKEKISRLSARECEDLLQATMACADVAQVEELLTSHSGKAEALPLLRADLVKVEGDSETKEEAIRDLINSLYIAGRTENPDKLEEVIWARESAYSTGLGHGFAIPHCRSDAVAANSVSVLRLKQSIEWDSLDGQPVDTVILLAVRESDGNNSHMQVLAKLARKLMSEQFRRSLKALQAPEEILAYLSQELEIAL